MSDLDQEDDSSIVRPGRGTLVSLIRVILRHSGPLLGGFGMILLATASTLLEPRLFGYAIDEAIIPGNLSRLRVLTLAFLAVVILRVISVIGQAYLFEILGNRVTLELRTRLYAHLLSQPASIYDRNPAGRLLTRVTNDIAALGEMFSAGFVTLVSNALLVIGILIWLLVLDLRLGLIAASVFPLMVAAAVVFSRKLKVAYRDARTRLSALNAYFAECLFGMRTTQLFGREEARLARYDELNLKYSHAQQGSIRIFALFQPTITLAVGVAMALVIGFGGDATARGDIKPGVLVAFFSFVMTLFQPVREIADKWNVFLSGMASAERVFETLRLPAELPLELDSVRPLEGIRGEIVFEDVWFAYEGENWVLQGLSLRIPAGARVGVVGHTGAGKTTLISLILRFYTPQKGRILLDGRDLRDYDLRRLRATIGIVQQEAFLYSGGLLENATLWDEAREPRARELLPERSRDDISERGGNLSAGERQLVSFARAAAADPSIWILDEATSNLDSRTESDLQKRLESATRGRTLVVIAHRLATIRQADLIVVLHRGHLIEQGKHAELVRLDGVYARLHRYQQAEARVAELES